MRLQKLFMQRSLEVKLTKGIIDAKFLTILNVVAVIGTIIWLLQVFGVFALANITVPHLN